MAKPSRGHSPSTPVRSLLHKTVSQFFAVLKKGIKLLGTSNCSTEA